MLTKCLYIPPLKKKKEDFARVIWLFASIRTATHRQASTYMSLAFKFLFQEKIKKS